MIISPARRTLSVKEYYFSVKNKEIARLNAQRAEAGLDAVINLGIGSPDGTPPRPALETVASVAVKDGVHGYQSYTGIPELREAFASWYSRFYGVTLDPTSEIQPLTGSKEGILLIMLSFLDKGDKVLIPDPGYPTYNSASLMVEAEVLKYDLLEKNGWYPDFEALEAMDLTGVKMMWTNYPGMPTGAQATPELYAKLVDFARRHSILLVNDNPYSFIRTREHLSILAVPGAKECCLEMNSLSKAHNMAGWRIGMVAGEADYIKEILKVKSQMDSGIFRALQLAAVQALKADESWFSQLNAEYYRRADVAFRIMDAIGATYDRNAAGLFVWGRLPAGMKGVDVSDRMLYNAGVFITPGFIFGKNGENYIRISLCAPVEKLTLALEKVEREMQNV
ncbi:MAG: aminotransferase class I/II-fold pyridoxal phosphate-dependent enzyme [Bacteroidales bacterium]|nr:aminotransferase class I/II-fold pyridoxal phosphate-dependent enzyme [Bacteroidales bacterium]